MPHQRLQRFDFLQSHFTPDTILLVVQMESMKDKELLNTRRLFFFQNCREIGLYDIFKLYFVKWQKLIRRCKKMFR